MHDEYIARNNRPNFYRHYCKFEIKINEIQSGVISMCKNKNKTI
jgi:hypothetical protein